MTHPAYRPIPLEFHRLPLETQRQRISEFAQWMRRRRTVRHFSPEPVPLEIIEAAISVAAGAPSGANMQPWRFVVVSDPAIKRQIREAAEAEERESYERRMPDDWLSALAPLGTDWRKEFLEVAPYLIVGFLSKILGRPKNEKPYLLIPVGYPAPDAVVPRIEKKSQDEVRILLS